MASWSPRPAVQCCSSWICHGDVFSVLHVSGPDSAASTLRITERGKCVTLELPSQVEDGLTCTLSLLCDPQESTRILDVTLCTEAKTIEVYSCTQDGQDEEYLGTNRGERHCTFSGDGEDPATFYKTYLKLDVPVSACKVKLLSLGGRRSVLVGEISVELTSITKTCTQSPSSLLRPSIDLERVQSIMDSMGGKMSPGAEQLMNMVRAQQKNQMPFGAHLLQMFGGFPSGRDQNKEDSRVDPFLAHGTSASRLETNKASEDLAPCHQALPISVNSLMSGSGSMGQAPRPESLMPLLQNLTLQLNQQEGHGREPCLMSREEKVDPALEKLLVAHTERMERNLMKHIDERMKHLQDHLDSRLDQLVRSVENSRSDQPPVTPGDKLINGYNDHRHEQEKDMDVFIGR